MATAHAGGEPGIASGPSCVEPLEFRQLRHQTKNALQRILIQVLETPGLCRSREGQHMAHDVARRIRLSAAISDALFGFTRTPEPLPERLRSLSESIIALHTDEAQTICLDIAVSDSVNLSRRRQDLVVRIIEELVGNAVKYGMHMRLLGHISIRLACEADGSLTLSVVNDGWPMELPVQHGEGLGIVRELARSAGGDMQVKTRPRTAVELRLPRDGARALAPKSRHQGSRMR